MKSKALFKVGRKSPVVMLNERSRTDDETRMQHSLFWCAEKQNNVPENRKQTILVRTSQWMAGGDKNRELSSEGHADRMKKAQMMICNSKRVTHRLSLYHLPSTHHICQIFLTNHLFHYQLTATDLRVRLFVIHGPFLRVHTQIKEKIHQTLVKSHYCHQSFP